MADSFDDFLPLTPKRTAPGEYDIEDRDGRVLWRMEGAALAEWVCSTLNARPALNEWREASEATQAQAVEFIAGGPAHKRYVKACAALRSAGALSNETKGAE